MTKKGYEQFSTTLPIKFIKELKLQAFKEDVPINVILEKYREAYLEKIEREKAEKKAKEEK